jgi:GTP cyclohydrolase II
VLTQQGITVVERVAHQFPTNPHNAGYLATKKARAGHML